MTIGFLQVHAECHGCRLVFHLDEPFPRQEVTTNADSFLGNWVDSSLNRTLHDVPPLSIKVFEKLAGFPVPLPVMCHQPDAPNAYKAPPVKRARCH